MPNIDLLSSGPVRSDLVCALDSRRVAFNLRDGNSCPPPEQRARIG